MPMTFRDGPAMSAGKPPISPGAPDTTTSTTSSTTTTSTSMGSYPVIPPGCNGPLTIPKGCPCSLNCSNCVGSVCNTVTGFCE